MPATQRVCLLVSCFVLTALLITGLSGCSAPAGSAEDGKRWYMMNNCSSCHGLHGNDGRAVDIAQPDMGFGSFMRRLRKTGDSIMPSYPESKLSKQDVADIYAYLKSIKK
jgi:mono/diheme cytochrome c family protein